MNEEKKNTNVHPMSYHPEECKEDTHAVLGLPPGWQEECKEDRCAVLKYKSLLAMRMATKQKSAIPCKATTCGYYPSQVEYLEDDMED